jgi:hypothetical protein
MEPERTDRSYPLFGKVPLPPVMIQQLDMVLTLGFLQPLGKKVLENFQKIVLSNKPKSWMTIYLITFMSLYSCARLTAENYQNARKHGLKVRFQSPSRSTLRSLVTDLGSNSGDSPCQCSSLNGTKLLMSFWPTIIIAQNRAVRSSWIGRSVNKRHFPRCQPMKSTSFSEPWIW